MHQKCRDKHSANKYKLTELLKSYTFLLKSYTLICKKQG